MLTKSCLGSYGPHAKVVLVPRKVAWADTCVVIVNTQGSAHATLRSNRKTLPNALNFIKDIVWRIMNISGEKKSTSHVMQVIVELFSSYISKKNLRALCYCLTQTKALRLFQSILSNDSLESNLINFKGFE